MQGPVVDQRMPSSAADQGEIDLIALFREVARRKAFVLAVTLATLALATIAVNVISPRYTGETRVFLENRDTEYTRIGRDGARGSDPLIDQDAVLSQIQLIQSRDIARAMIKRFDLTSKPEFDDLLNGVDPVTKVGVLIGVFNNPAAMSPEERVLEKYFDKLKAFAVARSRVIAIEFQSKDPELAARLSDAIAEEYISQLELAKKASARSAGSWLGRTIESLRERVAAAESRVEEYRNRNGLFLVGSASEGSSISAQQLSELNTQLATARAQQAELNAKARIIREAVRQGRIFEVSDIVNNEVVRRLIETRATLKAQIAQEERTLLPQHPRIKELYAQLAGLEEQIRNAAERTARTMENDARGAGARVAASQAELDLQKRQSSTANEQEVQLRALEREAKAEREQLENYLARYRDASVRDGDNAVAADARIVSRAIAPRNPSFPKKMPIIIVATVAGFVVALFWILTRALLSEGVYARAARHAPVAAAEPMAWDYANPGATARPAPPNEAVPAEMAPPQLSEAALAMRMSLDKMRRIIRPDAPPEPQPSAAMVAPPLAPEQGDLSDPLSATSAQAGAETFAGEPDHPLNEIAREAVGSDALPVSIIVLSAGEAADSAQAALALERVLSGVGPTILASLEREHITPAGLEAAAASLAASHRFVIFDAGKADARSPDLSDVTTLTVVVAASGLPEAAVEQVSAWLGERDHFIVDEEAASHGV